MFHLFKCIAAEPSKGIFFVRITFVAETESMPEFTKPHHFGGDGAAIARFLLLALHM
jgi:hypothetical protein